MTVPPEKIGHYRIEGWLGSGGMGEVYRARDERLDRAVALKRIKSHGDDPARSRWLARREARAVARLSHPAIVQVHDLVEDDHGDWLVMELIEGRSLRQVLANTLLTDAVSANTGLARATLAPDRVIEIGKGIAAGLAAAHAAGLIHRDLKVENVMLTSAGQVKVLDFGIAKQLPKAQDESRATTLSDTGRILGTVTAMSPEQAMGDPIDPRSDLFSLGSLLYELLTGISPFRGGTRAETLNRICTYREVPADERNPAVPRPLADLIGRLLEKERERRPRQASEVVAALDRLRAESVSQSRRTEPTGSGAPDVAGPTTHVWGLDRAIEPSAPRLARSADSPAGGIPAGSTPAGNPQASERGFSTWRAGILRAALVVAMLVWIAGPWKSTAPATTANQHAGFEGLENHELFERGMELVKYEYREGNVDRGIEAFQRMIDREEDSAPAYAGLARAYWRKYTGSSKDRLWLDRALPAAERAVELDTFSKPARISRGLAYAEAGRLADAEADFRHVQGLAPNDPEALYGLAHIAKIKGDLEQAGTLYQRALIARPNDWELHLLLGVVHYRLARYADAKAAFSRSIEHASDNVVAYRNLSAVHYQLGALPQAEAALQKALEIRPMGTLYNNLAILYFSQGLYAQAVAASEKAVQMPGGANHYLHWANLGDAYRWSVGQEQRARTAFLRAAQLLEDKLEANPEDVTSRSRQAVYYAKLGGCQEALTEAAVVAGSATTGTTARFRLALVYEICGQREHALETLEQALRAGHSLQDIKSDPELLQLREDPRYHQLAARFESSVLETS